MRLRFAEPLEHWPAWLPAIVWMLLLACLPWWAGLPLLLACAVLVVARLPGSQRYAIAMRRALRWGLAGVLVAIFFAFDRHALGLTFAMLAALVGFSLLVLLESWQDRKPQRNAAIAVSTPEWSELALAPIGPVDTLIELQPPSWRVLGNDATDVRMIATHSCCIGDTRIDHIDAQLAESPGHRWMAFPAAAGRGVVLYDRVHEKPYRLRGWQLYGWHGDEAWLSSGEDQPPMALSHVLGHDHQHET